MRSNHPDDHVETVRRPRRTVPADLAVSGEVDDRVANTPFTGTCRPHSERGTQL